jgi:hypothetical protein
VAGSREQITYGDWDDEDANLSPDGKRLFFTSDRDGGIYNIYSVNLDTGETFLHTNVVGGCFSPTVLLARDGSERLVFAAYYKRRFGIYVNDSKKPFRKLAELNPAPSPAGPTTIPPFQPSIEVSLDPEKINKKPSRKLYLENAQVVAGLSSDQTFLSNTILTFGDNLGDRQFVAALQTVSSFTNILFAYTNLSHRLQWGAEAYDQRYYFLAVDNNTGQTVRSQLAYRFTGGDIFGNYPLNRYWRLENQVGFLSRKYDGYPVVDKDTQQLSYIATSNDFPNIGTKIVGDTTQYESFGPISGRAMSLGVSWSPYVSGTKIPGEDSSTLTLDLTADLRHYFKILPRTLFAVRLYGFRATGALPDVLSFGGLDTLRNIDIYGISGNTAAFANLEFRFPLIDFLATPILGFREIRGKAFFDIGGAAYKNQNFSCYANGQLQNCISDYGFGISLNFLGLPLHFDFSRLWNFKQSIGAFKTFFYIGPEF